MPDPADRLPSFEAFWPRYLADHDDPRSRWMHFAGTSGFFGVLISCVAAAPLRMAVALALGFVLMRFAWTWEAKRSAAPALLGFIALCALAQPFVLVGVVFAYAFAWVGHFLIEKNRPATFTYPVWSLAGDFRMYGKMLRGQLSTGRALTAGAPA